MSRHPTGRHRHRIQRSGNRGGGRAYSGTSRHQTGRPRPVDRATRSQDRTDHGHGGGAPRHLEPIFRAHLTDVFRRPVRTLRTTQSQMAPLAPGPPPPSSDTPLHADHSSPSTVPTRGGECLNNSAGRGLVRGHEPALNQVTKCARPHAGRESCTVLWGWPASPSTMRRSRRWRGARGVAR